MLIFLVMNFWKLWPSYIKCIAWFFRVKTDERAEWSDIGKPDRDTVLWAGTKIEMVLTRVE